MRYRSPILTAACGLALAACSDAPTDPAGLDSQVLSADVARMAADAVGEDVALMRDHTLGFLFGVAPPPPMPGPRTDHCSFDGEWHSCGPIERDELTFFRQIAFYDGAGLPMQHYDGLLTASIRMKFSVEGSPSGNAWSATIERTRDFIVSGLEGNEPTRIWNGTGHGLASRSRHTDGGAARTYDMEETTTVDDVVVPHPRHDQQAPWPLSGTVTRQVSIRILDGDGNVLREATRTVVVTFNGTRFATMTVTGPNGTETFTVDLEQRRAHRP